MLLNAKLASDLLSTWIEDQNHPYRGRNKRTIPTIQELEILLNTLFEASLLKEEGISIITSVAWISKNDFLNLEIPQRRETDLCLYFDSPIDFCARNIAKMNGITNGNNSTLLAHGNSNSYKIWGICYFETENEIIGQIPASAMCIRHFSPDCPTIIISGIGSLKITRANSTIGRIEGGKFIQSHPEVFVSDMLGKYIYKLIGITIDTINKKFKNEDDISKSRIFISSLKYIIDILAKLNYGATIIIVPNHEIARSHFDCSWTVTGSLEIDLLQDYVNRYSSARDSQKTIFGLKFLKSLTNRLRNLSDLAKMDGALILTPDFKIVGFGAKLKSPQWKGSTQCGYVNHSNSDLLDFSRLGTRHNSALNFVGSVDGAIAFVSSSDGPIRALTKDDKDKVIYWSDCRVSMFK